MKTIKKSFVSALPIAFGYIPLGIVCGVLLQKAGLNVVEIFLMSLLVFAGSSQFVAASMIAGGSTGIQIVVATFMINLRHMLYSSSLSLNFKEKKISKLMLISHYITDESYAVNIKSYKEEGWNENLTLFVGVFANIFWIVGTCMGGLVGEYIAIPVDIASFVLTSMFIVLLIFQISTRIDIIMCLVSLAISLIVLNFYQGGFSIVLIALTCASIGYIIETVRENKGEENV